MHALVTMQFLLEVPDDGASAYDAMNEILRGKQREFERESCLIDYAFRGDLKVICLDPSTYTEGDAFTEEL